MHAYLHAKYNAKKRVPQKKRKRKQGNDVSDNTLSDGPEGDSQTKPTDTREESMDEVPVSLNAVNVMS